MNVQLDDGGAQLPDHHGAGQPAVQHRRVEHGGQVGLAVADAVLEVPDGDPAAAAARLLVKMRIVAFRGRAGPSAGPR